MRYVVIIVSPLLRRVNVATHFDYQGVCIRNYAHILDHNYPCQLLRFSTMPPRKKRTVKVEYEVEDQVAEEQTPPVSRNRRGRQTTDASEMSKSKPDLSDEPLNEEASGNGPVKAASKGRRAAKDAEGSESKQPKFEPPNWRTVLSNIQEMRKTKNAPVDHMGCERTMDDDVDPKVRRFQTLVSLMLSSQTKDPVTYAAMVRLKSGSPLTVQKMLDISEEDLGKTIIPVGFWRRKAQYIKKASQILRDQYNDDIPDSVEGLCSLPGVGPKMAYIAMHVAWEKNVGIGVDTHVHRIANRLSWTGPKETKTPEDTRKALQSWLPPEEWQEFNILLVGFGQTICLPIGPKCDNCLNKDLCPFVKSGRRNTPKKGKKPKNVSSTEESSDNESEVSQYF